ncbi:MAG TPA: carboxylesterase family protein [Candidatus Saccharimonadales bacterium]|nr:carboxylesterase family protein [Candidatus Saccharimonadales bacterium]
MAVAYATTSLVSTRQGAVRGAVVDGVHVFRAVPFAAPPFGANRLRAPQPVQPWTGVRDALVDGPKPPQPPFPGTENAPASWDRAPVGEDCLHVNIWTPELGSARLPVMIWITGGSFRAGSNAWYDGSRFARDGVVCVAINYRSGPEGFLYLRDGTSNRGLLDQIAAMQWVQDNIATFGGDPANVTLCGESAGAMSIGMLLAMPRARGLFCRAILESGAAHHVIPASAALRIGELFAERLGVAPTHDAMAALPYDRIIAAHAALDADVMADPDPARWGISMAGAMLTQPVIDGDIVPSVPIERIRSGSAADVDVIVGTNVDDWRMFLAFTGELGTITDRMITGAVTEFGSHSFAAYGLPAERGLAAYRLQYPSATPGELLAAIQTDWWCRIPAIRLADAHVNSGSRTYMYEFGWRSPVANGLFGACHALEIPFVFDTLDKGPDQMLGDLLVDSPQELATRMHTAWVSFITHGDPQWAQYDLDRRATMRFDIVSEIVNDPRATERTLWEGTR